MNFSEKRPLYLLKEIAAILRSKNGCAWDKKQTHSSLKPHLIEEAYELYDAIDTKNDEHIKEELGDVLYQVYAHAQIASETGRFTIDDVAQTITDKLIYRHPHVFGDEGIDDADEVIVRWEQLKQKEKEHRSSVLEGVPRHLPALTKAYRVQEKASKTGFDWDSIKEPLKKIEEEIEEMKEAMTSKDKDRLFEEAGDLLFSIVNTMRFLKISPEEALNSTTNRFMRRFKYIETKARELGQNINKMTLEEMDRLWEEAKANNT